MRETVENSNESGSLTCEGAKTSNNYQPQRDASRTVREHPCRGGNGCLEAVPIKRKPYHFAKEGLSVFFARALDDPGVEQIDHAEHECEFSPLPRKQQRAKRLKK